MSAKAELELKSALLSTGLVQPVDSSTARGVTQVLCRQVPGQERPWLQIAKELLQVAKTNNFDLHLCRRYLLKDDELVFGWHLGLSAGSAKAASEAVEKLGEVLARARPSLTSAEPPPEPPPRAPEPEQPRQRPEPRRQERPAGPGAAAAGRTYQPPGEGAGPRAEGVSLAASGVDAKGKPWTVEEMPLPHVRHDLNAPTSKGKGARGILEG